MTRIGCNGSCDQGRKPCTCPLDADHGKFVDPLWITLENLLQVVIVVTALAGLFVLLMESV